MEELLRVDADEWRAEVPLIRAHFDAFGDHLPPELDGALADLERRRSPDAAARRALSPGARRGRGRARWRSARRLVT